MSQQINLFNPALLKKREWLTATTLALGVVATLVCVVLWGLWARAQVHRLEQEAAPLAQQLQSTQEQLTSLAKTMSDRKPDPRLEHELKTAQGALLARQAVAGVLEKGLGAQAVGFAEYLRGFARQATAGVWLTGFTVEADGAGMEIRGRTTDPALLPSYIRRLSDEKAFRGRSFAALKMQEGALAPATPQTATVGTQGVPARANSGFHEFALVPKREGAEAKSGEAGESRAAMAGGMAGERRL